jgi:integrase/recombinase XerD
MEIMKIKMQQQETIKTMEEAFAEFIRYCNVKNLSEHTFIFYENCYKSFIKHYLATCDVKNISINTIYEYIIKQQAGNITANAINSNLRGVRAFLYYCMKIGYLQKFNIELIKAEKKIKQVYTGQEIWTCPKALQQQYQEQAFD